MTKMVDKVVGARLDSDLWKLAKKTAVDRDIPVGELVTIALKKELLAPSSTTS